MRPEHFRLNVVEEIDVLFDELPDLCVFLNFKAFGQIGFVVVKAFGRVGADDLNVGQCRQHHHQMANFDLDVGMRQHRYIGGRHKVKEQLALVQLHIFLPAVAVLCYGFLTIRMDDTTVLDFMRYAVRYLISTQQYFEWR